MAIFDSTVSSTTRAEFFCKCIWKAGICASKIPTLEDTCSAKAADPWDGTTASAWGKGVKACCRESTATLDKCLTGGKGERREGQKEEKEGGKEIKDATRDVVQGHLCRVWQ